MRPIRSTRINLNPDATIQVALLYDGIRVQEIDLKIEEWHEVLQIVTDIMIENGRHQPD